MRQLSIGQFGAVHLLHLRPDVAITHPKAVQIQDIALHPVAQPAFLLANQLGLKTTVVVARGLQLYRTIFASNRFALLTIATIGPPSAFSVSMCAVNSPLRAASTIRLSIGAISSDKLVPS